MRIILPLLSFFLVTVTFSPMAHADRIYFYKQADKTLKKDARFDTHWFQDVREKFPGVSMRYNLPVRRSNKSDEISTGISFVLQSDETHYFSIDEFAIRSDEKIYSLRTTDVRNITPDFPRYDQITAYESVGGKVRTKYEIKVDKRDAILNALFPGFYFDVSPLPKRLYLDYKFKIQKEGGPAEVFEGTIPMELTSYSIGLWETMWS